MPLSIKEVRGQTCCNCCRGADEGFVTDEVDQEQPSNDAPYLHEWVEDSLVGGVPAVTITGLAEDDDARVDHDENHNFEPRC